MTRALGTFGSLLTWLGLALVVVSWLGYRHWFAGFDEQLRAHAERCLARQWPHLQVSIQSARWLGGQGIELRGIHLRDSTLELGQSLVLIDEVLVRCDATLHGLLQGRVALREVVLRRPKIVAVRQRDGAWNLARLAPAQEPCQHPPIVHLEYGTVEILDRGRTPAGALTLREVQGMLRVVPAEAQLANHPLHTSEPMTSRPAGVVTVSVTATGDYWKRAKLAAQWSSPQSWSLDFELSDLNVSDELRRQLPLPVSQSFERLGALEATCSIKGQMQRCPDRAQVLARVDGRVLAGRYLDPRLPFPVTDIRGDWSWDGGQLRVPKCSARYGGAYLEGSATCADMPRGGPMQMAGAIRGLQLDQRLIKGLFPTLSHSLAPLQLRGEVDARFEVQGVPGSWRPRMQIEVRDAAAAWQSIPYPLERIRGTVSVVPENEAAAVQFHLLGHSSQCPIELRGTILQPGATWTGWCDFRTQQPLPLEERLFEALPERWQPALLAFAPRGRFTIAGRAARNRPGEPVTVHSSLEILDASVRHVAFPYPLQDVRGHVEQDGRHWQFQSFTASNDSGRFQWGGTWDAGVAGGGKLHLDIEGVQVPMEDELKLALKPGMQRLWEHMQPEGTLDRIQVTYDLDTIQKTKHILVTAQKWDAPPSGSKKELTLTPVSFPYRLDDVTGTVTYQDGAFRLSRFRACHGRVAVAAEGDGGSDPSGHWELRLDNLLMDRCRPDGELLAALPPRMGDLLRTTGVNGEVVLQGKLRLAGVVGDPGQRQAGWDLFLDVDDVSLDCGLPMRGVCGDLHLRGQSDAHQMQCWGDVEIDTLMARDLHCTNVRGPVWMDDQRIFMGRWAMPSGQAEAAGSMTLEMLGGTVAVDVQAEPVPGCEVTVEGSAHGIDLARVASEFAASSHLQRGRAATTFRLAGIAQDPQTWRGEGRMQLRETNLYELPVMLALLKQASSGSRDRTAFDASDIAFRLQGPHVYFDQIDLKGDALTLKGVGEMNLRRELNLNFYTMMGREESYLPAVRPLLGLASQRFLLIRVSGTVDHPRTSREVLPELNATLAQLFPEVPVAVPAPTPAPGSIRTVAAP